MSEASTRDAEARGGTAAEPLPVRVVSQKIGAWITRLGWVWVDGQVAQITRRPGNQTVFLTLRDPAADISLTVTAHRDVLDAGAPGLAEGARIIAHARPDFYPNRGTLSLRADEVRQVGLGELLARLERLKKQLAAEGLFDPSRKRRPPFLPGRVGLVTGRASAAERDVLTNARRRWPAVEFRVIPVAVQGPSAVTQIVEALARLDEDPSVEVIILARGGGSVEDLLPFSDETLCRAVFACHTPVISAIGHETDVPLVDFVADVRASTPTDAAKRAVPDLSEEVLLVETARRRLDRAITQRIDREQQRLDALRSRPVLVAPTTLVDQHVLAVAGLRSRAHVMLTHRLERAESEVAHTLARLRSLSPLATLERGYAVVRRVVDGAVVRAPGAVAVGEDLRVRLAEGELAARVIPS
ncbi:MAG TPA: exodeoxyribonuclease VII large subunit [Micromonosporaceae bacterium]